MSRILAWTALVLLVIAAGAVYAAPSSDRPATVQSAVLLIAIVVALEGIVWLAIAQTLGFATLTTVIVGSLLSFILVVPQTAAAEATAFQALVLAAAGGYGLSMIGAVVRLVDRAPRRGAFDAPASYARRTPSPYLARDAAYPARNIAPRIVQMERTPEHTSLPALPKGQGDWSPAPSRWQDAETGQLFANRQPMDQQHGTQRGARH